MSVFRKLFSSDDDAENNKNSENLKDAYDSLGGGADLDPDVILGGADEALSHRDDTDGVFDVQADYESDLAAETTEAAYDSLGDAADLAADEMTDLATEAAYDSLGGDTGEMDLSTIRETAYRVDEYISSISEAEQADDIPHNGDFEADEPQETEYDDLQEYDEQEPAVQEYDSQRYDQDTSSAQVQDTQALEPDGDLDDAGDEVVYAAYAPKSMRPQITQRSYYDLDNIDSEDTVAEPSGFKAALKKHARLIAGSAAAAVVVVGIIVACVVIFSGSMDPLMGYTATNAVKGNVIKTMAAGGNVEPNARYEISPLVSGTVTESPLNAGDEVKSGELVYKIDDTNAQLAVQMAEKAVERAKVSGDNGSSGDSLRIYANASGTISDLRISSGSTVNGSQIAKITQSDGTEISLVPNVTGTVQTVAVRNGSTVTSGQVIATLKSTSSGSSAGQKLDVEGSELALEQAQKELEKYKIASPIDGTILVKNAKIGDNVAAGKTDKPLMVIADMSKMKFSIEVDELDIWNIKLGQTVVITANALPGETFSGEITNIAGEGDKKDGGVTTYAVEITISDPGKIKSGMNVDAKIILNSAINVLTLPENALYESDGQNALVITNSSSVDEKDVVNSADYPHITVPSGYKLVKVRYGVNDGTAVEIISGLSVGDAVLYKADADSSLNSADSAESDSEKSESGLSADPNTENAADSDSVTESFGDQNRERSDNLKSTGKSALQEDLGI